jgi:hypothetical protein
MINPLRRPGVGMKFPRERWLGNVSLGQTSPRASRWSVYGSPRPRRRGGDVDEEVM